MFPVLRHSCPSWTLSTLHQSSDSFPLWRSALEKWDCPLSPDSRRHIKHAKVGEGRGDLAYFRMLFSETVLATQIDSPPLSNPKPQTGLSSPSPQLLPRYKQIPGPINTGGLRVRQRISVIRDTDCRSGSDRHTAAPQAEAGGFTVEQRIVVLQSPLDTHLCHYQCYSSTTSTLFHYPRHSPSPLPPYPEAPPSLRTSTLP